MEESNRVEVVRDARAMTATHARWSLGEVPS